MKTFLRILGTGASASSSKHVPSAQVFNIGNNNTVELSRFIETVEQALGRQAIKEYLPMQPGDVPASFADVSDLERVTGFKPRTSIEEGIGRFIEWYRAYYGA